MMEIYRVKLRGFNEVFVNAVDEHNAYMNAIAKIEQKLSISLGPDQKVEFIGLAP